MLSERAFPTEELAQNDALKINSFRRRLLQICQNEFYDYVENVRDIVIVYVSFTYVLGSLR